MGVVSTLAAATVVLVVALLVAEWFDSRRGVWIAKPLASLGFVSIALASGATESAYGGWVLVALVLSLCGDVLLIPRERPAVFQAGLLSFLLGHVSFAVAFLVRGVDSTTSIIAAVVLSIPALIVLRWLKPHLPDDMRVPVYAYIAVITTMVVFAVGTVASDLRPTILAGALLFYLSDLAVARDRFVSPGFVNGAWGLPLYYGAQVVLATTVAP